MLCPLLESLIMIVLGILLLVAAIAAACWKQEELQPAVVKETKTIKGWVAGLLLILAILCFGAGSSGEPRKVEKSKPQTVPTWPLKP
jgi:hypothetical protein